MKVIVHYPKNQNDNLTLQKKVAAVHADAVIQYIKTLRCPKEQKIKLIDGIIKTVQLASK